ncbi:hypothetical protein FRC03_011713 [Tulasnella sp. 419]|nr:hypothetical protein FRC03_011713 [Tulasnella sp. 419]
MPWFSSSRPSPPSRFDSTAIATLGGAQVALTLLEKMTDGIPVPFVKAAAGTAVEVIKMTQVIQANREECDDLMKRCTSLLIVILGSLIGKAEQDIPVDLKKRLETLTSNLMSILSELRLIESRSGKDSIGGKVKAGFYQFDNSRKLTGCSAKLDWALQEFQAMSKVDSCLKDLERHEDLKNEIKESRNEVKDDIKESKQDVKNEIKESRDELREGQKEILNAVRDKTTEKASSSLPSTTMPACPKIFGRNEYIAMAVSIIMSNTSVRLAILGPGGMGKTSAALCIVHDAQVVSRFDGNIIWVPCEQATSVNLLIELLGKSFLPTSSSSSDRLGEIIAKIKGSGELYMLLLDNFETPWDIPGQQSEVGDILALLASIPTVSFIVTMRAGQPPAAGPVQWTHPKLPPLPPLEIDPANEAFLMIAPDAAGDSELDTLLKELDCVPLAVTLMARLAEAGEQPSELLTQWRSERTKLLDQPDGDRRNSIEVSIKLSLESRLVKSNPDAINLLSVIAVLPAGASLSRVEEICPSIQKWRAALRILRNTALVYDSADKTFVQLLSPIRLYILLHHPLQPSPLSDLRKAYFQLAKKGWCNPGQPGFIENSKELDAEKVNMENILLQSLTTASAADDGNSQIIQAAQDYSWYLYWSIPQTTILEEAITLARASRSDLLPQCLKTLGMMLHQQGMIERAFASYSETKSEYLQAGNNLEAHQCGYWIGECLRRMNRRDEAYSLLKEEQTELHKLGDRISANKCSLSLGIMLRDQDKYEEAESLLEEARAEFIKEKDDHNAYESLRLLAGAYIETERYDKARSALEEVRERHLSVGNPIGVLYCQTRLGQVFCEQGSYKEAWFVLEEARIELEKRGLRNQVYFTESLSWGGRAARMLGKYEEAISRLEEAKALYTASGDIAWVNWCSRELDLVREAQESMEQTA